MKRLLSSPITEYKDYYDDSRFSLTWNLGIILLGALLFLTIIFYFVNPKFMLSHLFGVIIIMLGLANLYISRQYKKTAIFIGISGVIIVSSAIFLVGNSVHVLEPCWLIIITLYVYFALGRIWGNIFLIINMTVISLFLVFFVNKNLLNFSGWSTQLCIAMTLEFVLCGLILGAIIHQFIVTHQVAENKLKEANEKLRKRKIILEKKVAERTSQLNDALKEVKRHEKKFRTIFEMAPLGIVIVNTEGDIIDWNQSINSLWGYSNEEIRGKKYVEFTHPDDVDISNKAFEQLGNRGVELDLEKRYFKKDGNFFLAMTKAIVVKDVEGNVMFYLVMITDISERKNRESERLSIIWKTEEKERLKLGNDLHEGLAQTLVAIKFYASSFQLEIDKNPNKILENKFKETVGLLSLAIKQSKFLTYNLIPDALNRFGIQPTFSELINTYNDLKKLNIEFYSGINLKRYRREIEVAVFRLTQEFINVFENHITNKFIIRIQEKGNNLELTFLIELTSSDWIDIEHDNFKSVENRVLVFDGRVEKSFNENLFRLKIFLPC
ncbi:MAG: hypothetical protein COB15_06250 [Flavobacteriales bacterium]|nr:MAG: hypothetical protein COB15_06250 [Flavobacteriales bacterium]